MTAKDEGRGRSAGPSATARVLGIVVVVALVVSVVGIFALARNGNDVATAPGTSGPVIRQVPPVAERSPLSAPVRPSRPGAGSFTVSLPKDWSSLPLERSAFDRFVADRPGGAADPVAVVASRLQSVLFPVPAPPASTTTVVTVPGASAVTGTTVVADEAGGGGRGSAPVLPQSETSLAVVAAQGDGYVLATGSARRGADLATVEDRVVADLRSRGADVTASRVVVAGEDAVRILQRDPAPAGTTTTTAAGAAEPVIVHHVVLVGDGVLILTQTGSAPEDLADTMTIAFDPSPAVTPEVRRAVLDADLGTEAVTTVPSDWLDVPVVAAEIDAWLAGRPDLDPAVRQLVVSLQAGALAPPPPGEGSVALVPRLLAVEPFGRSYVLLSSVSVGYVVFDELLRSFEAASAGTHFEPGQGVIGQLDGAISTITSTPEVSVTTRLALAGPVLVSLVSSGAAADTVVRSLTLERVAPPPPPPEKRLGIVIKLDPNQERAIRFPIPIGWLEVPVTQDGFAAFAEAARTQGSARLADLLDRVGPLVLLDLGDLPFQIDLSGLPTPRWMGATSDGSTLVSVQLFPAEGRTLDQVAEGARLSAIERNEPVTLTKTTLGSLPAYKLTASTGENAGFDQYLLIDGSTLVTVLEYGPVPAETNAGFTIG